MTLPRWLFVCGKNRWRSPTAEQIAAEHGGVESASAGLAPESPTPVSGEIIEWAELIFVMEPQHKSKLSARFAAQLKGKRVICLRIQDRYRFMDPELIRLLQAKLRPYLP